MLMDASCPSKRLEAVTKRMWCFGLYVVVVLILILILLAFVGTWGQVPCPSVKLVNLCFTTKVVLLGMCGHSCVTVSYLLGGFRHADNSCVTVFTFLGGFGHARPSRVLVRTLSDPFRVRKNISRTRSYPFRPISRSQEHLAYSFEPFQTHFAFARPSRVLVRALSDPFRVRKNISRTRSNPFRPVSRSQDHLAYSFEPFQTHFAFARPSRVLVYTLSDLFRVRKNFPH
jgi:hypothetical protein